MPMADGAMFVKFHNIIQWKIIIKRGTNIFLLFFLFILHSVRFYSSRTLRDGNCQVFVEKCKYLEESKCLGVCINTCKLPTQTFFKDHMGVDLYMEPNFEDYSCQFNFGVSPPPLDTDKALKEPCLDICTNARRRKELGTGSSTDGLQCPQV
jgi:hypothetical protein